MRHQPLHATVPVLNNLLMKNAELIQKLTTAVTSLSNAVTQIRTTVDGLKAEVQALKNADLPPEVIAAVGSLETKINELGTLAGPVAPVPES